MKLLRSLSSTTVFLGKTLQLQYHSELFTTQQCSEVDIRDWTDLKHEHCQLLIVLPLLHGCLHICRSGWWGWATALIGKLSVKLSHLLKLLPQVLGNNLGPFYTHTHISNMKKNLIMTVIIQYSEYQNLLITINCLTYTRINHMPLLDFSFCDSCMIRTGHLNHPCWAHDRDWVLSQVSKDLLLFAKNWNLLQEHFILISETPTIYQHSIEELY